MKSFPLYPDQRSADPYRCLRCCAIGIGVWNIIYCLIQFGLLGWQIKVVKDWQWYWENRYLPATGAIDQFQSRHPGLYTIYSETPERRRVNAMYAIVLICMGLTIVHLPLSAAMLYGSVKRRPAWILPWFFTALPLIILCTTYSVLWWSGDIFNEQLTFSVFEFAMSLAVNGVCFVIVVLYNLRLRGKLTSERTNNANGNIVVGSPKRRRTSADERFTVLATDQPKLPPWVEPFPDKVPPNIARKLKHKERRERQLWAKTQAEKQEKAIKANRRQWRGGMGQMPNRQSTRQQQMHFQAIAPPASFVPIPNHNNIHLNRKQ